MKKWILLITVLVLPLTVWAAFKPIRILAPELVGIICTSHGICIDDPSRSDEAARLYEEAFRFVSSDIGTIHQRPKAVFCATEACFASFGFKRASAVSIGTIGIIIGPNGWSPHFVRHELIHHLQNEQLGTMKAWLITPQWLTEGMAYSLSQDPRANLDEPWQEHRLKFDDWYKKTGKNKLWIEASNL